MKVCSHAFRFRKQSGARNETKEPCRSFSRRLALSGHNVSRLRNERSSVCSLCFRKLFLLCVLNTWERFQRHCGKGCPYLWEFSSAVRISWCLFLHGGWLCCWRRRLADFSKFRRHGLPFTIFYSELIDELMLENSALPPITPSDPLLSGHF